MDDDPIYLCRRLTLHMEDRQAPGYTLVTNHGDRIFAGGLTFEETARRIAASAGERGTNIAYLAETVRGWRGRGSLRAGCAPFSAAPGNWPAAARADVPGRART